MIIIGAGLSGLIAAHAFPRSKIIERNPPRQSHKALLRFRSEEVSRITNIPFRKVTVHKGIYDLIEKQFMMPTIAIANQYSAKVAFDLMDRSIWNLEPCQRYIAPENFYDLLVDNVGKRVEWEIAFDPEQFINYDEIISTIPISVYSKLLGINVDFRRKPIKVYRFRIENSDVFQTIYYPTPHNRIYRASITGDLLMVETKVVPEMPSFHDYELDWVCSSFGIDQDRVTPIDSVEQEFGKIAPIPENSRRAIIRRLTAIHNIYSLGRFATWRNILLDDIVHDIDIIKRLIQADEYDTDLLIK